MKVLTVIYRGEEATTHPELGLLVPGEEKDMPERDLPALEAAAAAGLPLELAGITEPDPAGEGAGWDAPHVHASAQDEEE